MKVAIIGTGLIGGSMALKLRSLKYAEHFTGVEKNPQHAQKAIEKGIVEKVLPLEDALAESDLIILSIPVDESLKIVRDILDTMNDSQILMDAGSTKKSICDAVRNHPKRGRFVATHPMWGTEYSGPEAASTSSFSNNSVVICEKEKSDADALEEIEKIYSILQMKPVWMNAADHDLHAAYVSHISHITSFALANTVLEKEKEENAIFEMASGGFESTVRLAKSNPDMWLPIFRQNRENVLDVLNEHISQLKKFRSCFEKDNYEYMRSLIENANKIRKIIK